MANDEHVALLKKGVDAWNEWRSQNPQVDVNLRGASLSNKYFKGTNLYKANLSGANLSNTHLRGRTSMRRTSAVRTSAVRTSLV